MIQKYWKKFEYEMAATDQHLSQYVKREFEAFLGCGILSKGFIRLVCDTCKKIGLFHSHARSVDFAQVVVEGE